MQLVIKVDLDKARLSLPEIFKLVGDCREQDEAMEEPALGAEGVIRDNRSHTIGEWAIEEEEQDHPNPLESPYRAAAIARYVRPGQIEVDRFASVSPAENGAYVQGWLFVPQAAINSVTTEAMPPRKPPQSISPAPRAQEKSAPGSNRFL
jgi:hypothetical protein